MTLKKAYYIGIGTAKYIWCGDYQIIVTTHLNMTLNGIVWHYGIMINCTIEDLAKNNASGICLAPNPSQECDIPVALQARLF